MTFTQIFTDYTLQIVLLGATILGITSGSLGVFAVLRRQSLLGDAIAHATLPGVCLAFLFTLSKNPLILLLGAGISGWIGSLVVMVITRNTRIKQDAALGIVLSVFFGFGLVLITLAQKMETAKKAGLDRFLFGSAATLLKEDITIMLALGLFAILTVILLWKEFKIITFDKDYARSLGLPVTALEITLTTLIVVAIVIGLQTVGVVLMSAMIVAPAAAARQWTDRLNIMVIISALFGAISGLTGSIVSSFVTQIPTGPAIVVCVSFFVFFSLIFAPNRGLLWDWIRAYKNRRHIQATSMLKNLLLFSENHKDPFHPHDIAALDAIGRGAAEKTMLALEKKGWAQKYSDARWALTPKGLKEAKTLTQNYESQFEGSE